MTATYTDDTGVLAGIVRPLSGLPDGSGVTEDTGSGLSFGQRFVRASRPAGRTLSAGTQTRRRPVDADSRRGVQPVAV
ncbi:hypothetical protein GA0070560_11424 [Micromonospora halophytica]|uniref:Uncharacterized protein n=1 Tax=Micromonospora halophytica TaxID=47864 RepID=A0A1C5IMX4_9ACTN|nr:hypothetical protein GA0070560_11424 [Micromonospora halophytica]